MGQPCRPRLTDALFCPQIMSVLLFIEHSVEVAHGKASCRFSQTGYLRIGRSRGQEGEAGKKGEGPWLAQACWGLRPCHFPSLSLSPSSANGAIPPVLTRSR